MVKSNASPRALVPGRAARDRAVLTVLVALGISTAVTAQQTALPARLETFLNTAATLSRSERKLLVSGQPVTKLLDADGSKEVAVLGAVWIEAPIGRYVEAVKNIDTFETGGGFKVTRRVSAPPRLEDFDALRLPDRDLDDLRDCRVRGCSFAGAFAARSRKAPWPA